MTPGDPSGQPVIIEAAINGQTPKQLNPNVPRTSQEIAQDALRCIEAGAAIVHTHITDIAVPPARAAELYAEHFQPVLEACPDALLYPTLGFGTSIEDRFAHIE
ncbi:MAG: 3-keto-5-aminohexanoate cleavage protein, partial [Myxococcota bacterium]